MTMRVLRFLRPARSAATALKAGSNEALGLDAFATEAPSPATAVADGASAFKWRMAVIALAVLVILEAIPTVMWIRGRLAPAQPVAVVAAAPITPAPLPSGAELASAPCAAPPASQASASVVPASLNPATAPAKPAAPAMVAGLVAIEAPVPMHVYTDNRLVGTTEADAIMLPVGEHDLELVSESVGFRAHRTVTVQAGRTSSVRIEAPRVPMHVNAIPWAEVWIDNQRMGETPLGNLQQTIGTHEIVFRHPDLGERRTTVLVTLKEPARVSMDLRKR
jgi:hypothetical protein